MTRLTGDQRIYMQLAIALDLPSSAENLQLAESLGDFDDLWMKVGFRTYIRDGRNFLDTLRTINPHFKIFLDLKLYDIPNTMADAAAEIAELGVEMFNVHASAGERALRAVMERLEPYGEDRPLVLAVTALTSFSEEEFRRIYGEGIDEKAKAFARISYEAGLDGVVCSAAEARILSQRHQRGFLMVTPGIRQAGDESDDQRRVVTPSDAVAAGATHLVVGRSITASEDPAATVANILASLD